MLAIEQADGRRPVFDTRRGAADADCVSCGKYAQLNNLLRLRRTRTGFVSATARIICNMHPGSQKLDKTDRAILNELQQNGRVTNAELAATVGLSPSAALRRTRVLEQEEIIQGYIAVVDRAAVGRGTTVFVEVSVNTQSDAQLDEFEAAIVDCPEVISCHLMAGEYDYLLQVACADVGDYERVHRDWISKMPGVSRIRSSFALREVCDRSAFDL